jgi:hypothetical protein
MKVNVVKLTDIKLIHKAIESTVLKEMSSKLTLEQIYKCRHSPIRTQLFWIELNDIYSYVSTHLVRHSLGVTHFVSSRREDRGGSKGDGRYSLVKHSMLINAEALIAMSNARLCFQASPDTTAVFTEIKSCIQKVDPALDKYLRPRCLEIGRCRELRPCGFFNRSKKDED